MREKRSIFFQQLTLHHYSIQLNASSPVFMEMPHPRVFVSEKQPEDLFLLLRNEQACKKMGLCGWGMRFSDFAALPF